MPTEATDNAGIHAASGTVSKNFARYEYFTNRELSWLEFNQRVLEEAMDGTNPLLERLKFMAIVSSNLDEFFMVRVAGVQDQIEVGLTKKDPAGLTPMAQMKQIALRAHELVKEQYGHFSEHIVPELRAKGIRCLGYDELNRQQKAFVEQYFEQTVYPVLTPMAVDQSRPFPLLANKSLNLAVLLEADQALVGRKTVFAFVQIPVLLPRCIRLPSNRGVSFIYLEEVIKSNLDVLFRGNRVIESATFRITRNADLAVDEEGAEDLLEAIEKELQKRKWGAAVRLEIEAGVSSRLKNYLKDDLELGEEDVYLMPGPLDLTAMYRIADLPGFEHLRHRKMVPSVPEDLADAKDLYQAISQKDILVHHPYESFQCVIDFVTQAANDPHVLAIKQTLYRVSGDSPIIAALADAATKGKQVTVLVELKARFDEERNIAWAKKLEQSGCHVVYGLVGLKTHAKITLVVRQEKGRIRRYVHLGTGNYNDSTARFYTDFGLFTCDERFGADATDFFNEITGYSLPSSWREIEVAPLGLRKKLLDLIEREISLTTPEKPGRIIAKMNSLTDEHMIQALYRASTAGVHIELIVRGICCLRPGIPGVSEHIKVISIVDRFLEHHRIYYFHNGGQEELYLSSADLMTRNLDRRVELLFPVKKPRLLRRIKGILIVMLHDNVRARRLRSDGKYDRVQPQGQARLQSQVCFLRLLQRKPQRGGDRWDALPTWEDVATSPQVICPACTTEEDLCTLKTPGAVAPAGPCAVAPAESDAAAPEESDVAVPEESDAAAPEESGAAAPEESDAAESDESAAVAPEESDVAESDESAAVAPEESDVAAPEESDAAAPEESDAAESDESAAAESDESVATSKIPPWRLQEN
ncbi:RNA degradosome polyphosphate kinase [Heliophilum fasciatum]|uniref:Polyphosphate kinase n=1 Tax=Heliophilum fasciatum TaxID=35700 RepID=A0A4R2RY59_9FIRM|nr:RNA degradosome polyphosphate kinase [Heliophilum fasciatum]MCW2277592.1 polyphosphate kinase [Heliophilum fasciatum]TCP64941.1 polyphosphate kinase [Heliophilum fasciatum]